MHRASGLDPPRQAGSCPHAGPARSRSVPAGRTGPAPTCWCCRTGADDLSRLTAKYAGQPAQVLGADGDSPGTLGTWIRPAHLPQPSARTEVGSWLAASRSKWPARVRPSMKRSRTFAKPLSCTSKMETFLLTSSTHSSPRSRSASRRESGLAADLRSGSHSST